MKIFFTVMLNLFQHLYKIDSDLHQNDEGSGKGFTLVEMLVVIAVVGIISSVTLPNVLGMIEKGRDTKRKQDLKQIQLGLEMYRQDKGTYPSALPACGQPLQPVSLLPLPTPVPKGFIKYLQKTPCDPKTGNSYGYSSNSLAYALSVCMESATNTDKDVQTIGQETCSSRRQFILTNLK